jgi:hypothetical protein
VALSLLSVLSVATLAAPIDASARNGQRNPLLGPRPHLLEGWTHDPNEVTAVLLTEVGFELTTVVPEIEHGRSLIFVWSVVHGVMIERVRQYETRVPR